MDLEKQTSVSKQEALLNKWHNKFMDKRISHIQMANTFANVYWILGGISLVLSVFGSIFSSVSAGDTFLSPHLVNIINGILHFIVLLIGSIMHFYNFKNLEQSHLSSSREFSELNRLVEYQQSLPSSDRNIEPIIEKYETILKTEPLIVKCC